MTYLKSFKVLSLGHLTPWLSALFTDQGMGLDPFVTIRPKFTWGPELICQHEVMWQCCVMGHLTHIL
jgi:hypothetical protein